MPLKIITRNQQLFIAVTVENHLPGSFCDVVIFIVQGSLTNGFLQFLFSSDKSAIERSAPKGSPMPKGRSQNCKLVQI